MNLLNYSLSALVVYLSLVVGFILAIIAKEELKAGKKYFLFLQKIILLLIFIFLLIYIDLNYVLVLLILAFIAVHLLKTKKESDKLPYLYIILAVIFYLSSKNRNLFVIESSLMFLYGLPTGTLLTGKSKKETVINILKNIVFVLMAVLLFLIF